MREYERLTEDNIEELFTKSLTDMGASIINLVPKKDDIILNACLDGLKAKSEDDRKCK